jgi:FMN-dependent NADH-azoreductase
MILYINACVREKSRTKQLADRLVSKMGGEAVELYLGGIVFPEVDEAFLKNRDRLIAAGEFRNPLFDLARHFAEADQIVIAAPYWDLSFPSVLKQYFEQINVSGITFMYTSDGYPKGLCKAGKLYYVMTAGGMYVPEEFGYGYVKALANGFYNIRDVILIKAVGLDIDGADVDGIMQEALRDIEVRFPST